MNNCLSLFLRLFCCSCFLGSSASLPGQNALADMDHDAHHLYDRMIILSGGGEPQLHSSIKPYWRQDLVSLADTFSFRPVDPVEINHLRSVWDQNNEYILPGWRLGPDSLSLYSMEAITFGPGRIPFSRYRLSNRPLWNTFYRTPAHFYEVDVKDFYLRVNPLVHIAAGRETQEGVTTFVNQRGLSIRGGVGKNVFFQTSLMDNQVRYSNYINQFTDIFGVVPGAGLFKDFKSNFFDFTRGRDFLLAQAYVGINLGKYIGFQLGHNQHFIGDGVRSLLLSDFSTPYFSLRINTRIWKFQYQNIFAELTANNFISASGPSGLIPKKYMAAHYLSFKPNKKITLGLFESVIFNRDGNQFELQYLNPIILYRTIEGSIGSPDNVLLGLNARVDALKSLSFYGQFILDDILIGNILDGRLDWWGNKFGHQLGAKYINVLGVHFLDAQLEWNQVRPYTYSHYDENANYSNYKQPLAHPLGANFNEWIASIRFQASPRLHFLSRLFLITTGEDTDSISYGGNVIAPNTLRPGDFGHTISQGIKTDIAYWSTAAWFEVSSGVFLDGQFVYRIKTSELAERSLKTNMFQVGVRYNIARRNEVF